MKRFLMFLLVLLTQNAVFAQGIGTQDLSLKLGNFDSKAQLTYPADKKGPFAAVLLIHGSTPMDMDASVQWQGQTVSSIFKQLSEGLGRRGFAVLRYNKRYVSGPGKVDAAAYYGLRLQDFLSDARVALNALQTNPLIDKSKIFVYGWSEGSPIAAQLALETPSIKGLIVQGAVANSYAQTLEQQFPRVGIPYLSTYAKNGLIDIQGVMNALMGDGGFVALSQAYYLLDRTSTPTKPKLNTVMDANKDGSVDLALEAKPVLDYWFRDDPSSFLGIYASAVALPGLIQLAPKLETPTLILQGQNDANISADDARALDKALNNSHTLKLYPNLGHSLGAASSPIDDRFRPMDARPIQDVADWLETQIRSKII
jgi:uncharacterized protein